MRRLRTLSLVLWLLAGPVGAAPAAQDRFVYPPAGPQVGPGR